METNIFQINLNSHEFKLYATTYTKDRLNELRKTYNDTHSFFRSGDDILSSKGAASEHDFGDIASFDANRDVAVTSSLLRHIFFRTWLRHFPQRKLNAFL